MSCISIGETAPCAALEITQGELRAIGWQLKNQDGTPVLVAGYGARLHIRERMNSPVALIELSNGAGLRLVDGICWFEPTLAQVNGLPTGNIRQDWVYDLFLEQPTASPIMVAQGKAIVYPRVTRWQAPEPSSISPDPVLIEAIVAGLQGPKGDKGDAGSGGMDAATYDPQNIAADAFDRANHTGTQLMETISDKQGKVLDDLTPLMVEDLDSAVVPKGYLVSDSGGLFDGAQLFVQQTQEGLLLQTIHIPVLGKSGFRTKPVGGGWTDTSFTIAQFDIIDWHGATTAEAPNAVINPNGTFSRSLVSHNPNPLLEVSGASRAFIKADVNKYARYTASGAKTATFDSSEGFTAGDAFHITNRAASGNITISGTGVTFNAPKGGTLVLEPKDTVTVKFISPTEADVMGSTGVA